MGGSQSVMSYAEACDVLGDAELRTMLAPWDRWRADEQLLSRDALCKGTTSLSYSFGFRLSVSMLIAVFHRSTKFRCGNVDSISALYLYPPPPTHTPPPNHHQHI